MIMRIFPIIAAALLAIRTSAWTQVPDPLIELQVRDKIALYALTVDTKDYNLLYEQFTNTSVSLYALAPGATPTVGVPALQTYLSSFLREMITQHQLSSIVVNWNGTNPNSTFYVFANYLGARNVTGTWLNYYAKAQDQWVLDTDNTWKIQNRLVTTFVSGSYGRVTS